MKEQQRNGWEKGGQQSIYQMQTVLIKEVQVYKNNEVLYSKAERKEMSLKRAGTTVTKRSTIVTKKAGTIITKRASTTVT